MAERIFDAVYADDPDGGPAPSRMYLMLKVGICHIRKKLSGSGVSIEHVGYRQGWRIKLDGIERVDFKYRRRKNAAAQPDDRAA